MKVSSKVTGEYRKGAIQFCGSVGTNTEKGEKTGEVNSGMRLLKPLKKDQSLAGIGAHPLMGLPGALASLGFYL